MQFFASKPLGPPLSSFSHGAGGETCDLLANNTALFSIMMPCADFSTVNVEDRCLDAAETAAAMKRIPEWTLSDDQKAVRRAFIFENFREAFAFLARSAQLQDRNDHHSAFVTVYNRVEAEWTNDLLGCLSTFDVESAAAMDALLTLPRM